MSEAQTAASMDGGGAIKLSEADLDKEETQEAAVEGEWSYHRGYAFDVGAEETASPSSAARAKRIRAEIGDEPLTGIESRPVYCAIKRAFDIVFSAAVLICFCWLFAIIAIVIKIDDPKGPVLFKQERVGKDGKTFTMHKFRTMCVDAVDKLPELQALNEKDGPVFKIARDPRNTRVGRVLRKASLDETIQFFDVLTGKTPLRILKTRPEFSEKSMGAFALPAKSSTNKEEAFSQVVSCFASGLRMRRISGFNCKRVDSMGGQFLAKPVFKAVRA